MDVPATVLNELKCSRCEVYLSRSPVFLQHDGLASCGRCFAPERPATRNKQYEAVARLLMFPCKYQELGCSVTVPYTEETEEIAHEQTCEYRQYVCPVLGSAHCDWLGSREEILQHCITKHPERVVNNSATFTHDITKSNSRNFILLAFEFMFLLHTKICVASGKIYHSIRFLGESNLISEFKYTLEIKLGEFTISRPGDVAPQGCLAIQEPTSVALSINSLLDVLGGFDGSTFTVTVTRRVVDEPERSTERSERSTGRPERSNEVPERSTERPERCTEQPERHSEQSARSLARCEKCNVEVTQFLYRNRRGWRCEHCAPPRNNVCKNFLRGCEHTDFMNKNWKHERYYCNYRTECFICNEEVSSNSLYVHYSVANQLHRKFISGSKCRVNQLTEGAEVHFLIASVAGLAVCWGEVIDSVFKFSVYTPVSTKRLREFLCKVQLTDPATSFTRTYTPRAIYTSWWDWHIEVQTSEFPCWSRDFIFCVDITREEQEPL